MNSYWYLIGLLALLCSVVVTEAQAQSGTGTLVGEVVSSSGDVLPGVNVLIPAENQGAATDMEGRYRIEGLSPGSYEIRAQFVGFRTETATVTITAGQETVQDFVLTEDLMQMEEIVVTGLGQSVERRKLSADVGVISATDIEEAPVSSLDQLLQGRVPGSSIRAQSAQPGQGALINFRGITSVFASQTPVIYIDGVRVDNNSSTSLSFGGESTSALSELLTNDIERVEITKGGAASTLYGSDAANGVIQIFTRQGQEGAPRITFRMEQGVDLPVTKFFRDTGFSFADAVNDPESPDFGRDSFIADEILKTGHTQNYYAGVSGGSESVTYNVSGRVQNGSGIQPNNENTLYALRSNIQSEFSDQFNVGFSGAYTRSNFSRLSNGTAFADPLTAFEVGDAKLFTGRNTLEGALDMFLAPTIKEGVDRFTFSASAGYAPSDLFESSLTVGLDSRVSEQRRRNPAEADPLTGNTDGVLTRFDRNYKSITLDYQGTISYPRDGRFTSDFTFGVQGFREEISTIFGEGETLIPGSESFGEAGSVIADETQSEIFNGGVFAREQIGIADRVFVNAGLRLDGNSAFGSDIGLQAYPSLGIAYTISDEPFWSGELGSVVNELKLRAAYGETGKFPEPFARDFSFQSTAFRGNAAPRFLNPGDTDLRPERTATLEGGLEAGFFDSRVGLNLTVYASRTTNAIFDVPEPPLSGLGLQLRNIGEIQNRGIELDVDATVIAQDNLRWSLGAAYGYVKNEITDMGGEPDFNLSTTVSAQQRISEGQPVGAWRAWTPFDSNGDGLPDATELRFTGSTPYPIHTGSFTSRFTIGENISVFALADWALGAEVFDWGSHWAQFNGLVRAERTTQYDEAGNEIGLFRTEDDGASLLQDGDYLKIREVSVSYRLPDDLIAPLSLSSASVSLAGRNLFTFSRQDLVDPELAGLTSGGGLQLGGTQSITLSPPRQVRLSLEVTL